VIFPLKNHDEFYQYFPIKSRVVSTEEAEKFAKEHQMLFIETSAINAKNVENV